MRQKFFLSLIIPLIFQMAFGQELFQLRDDQHVLLDKGWKYKMGDDPAWAKPQFDDRLWKPINPALDIHDSLAADARKGIGWLRLKFHVGEKAGGKYLALSIQQSVASEIYLNGVRLISYGTLSNDPSKIVAFDPIWKPIVFPISEDSIQLLAVRFVVQPGILYTTIFESKNSLVGIESVNHDRAVDFFERINGMAYSFQLLLMGISIMIFIIHFAFYLFVPEQKANLYFSLSGISYVIVTFLQLRYYLHSNVVESKFYIGNISFFFIMLSSLFIMISLYTFLNRKMDIYFKFLLAYFFISIGLNAFPYDFGWRVGGPVFQILAYFNLVRISVLSIKQGRKGSRILTVGAIATFILFITFVLQGTFTNSSFLQTLTITRMVNYFLYTLSIPAAMSYYLAQDFALTGKRLKLKLEEVNDLSQRNLVIEKEKQEMLASQNQQLEIQVKERTNALSKSLEELRATQAQLIQSEKMASLGELTAGIAHEIQNPLNFVNNFSEVNAELSEEILEATNKGDLDAIRKIAKDIKTNQEKINEHGQRADGIVKSMLQHSRSSSGTKEPSDINNLVDEYLKLAYHGLRAKDKSFNVTLHTSYDPLAGSPNIIPQDIGRVVLNLFNNAFYAVMEKKRTGENGYEPTVIVTTARQTAGSPDLLSNGHASAVKITIEDNGNGIPEKVKDKIFQPFFTTKPTGEGTGLGLSLSYDIITKVHGGGIEMETETGKFTRFIVYLPMG